MPKVDSSNIIYPGSLTSCGFDELGEHGMVVGEINDEQLKFSYSLENRLLSDIVKCKFIKMDETQFEIKEVDITNYTSTVDVLKNMELKDNIYRIVLTGIKNVDVEKLTEEIKLSKENVCEVIDETKNDYDLQKIASEKTLKGVFTRNMLIELEKHPENEYKIMKAIEYVYNNS